MASRTSLTARSVGVPIANWTNVLELPSRIVELISSIPLTPRTAASTFCVTCVSISLGAAPGCEMLISAAGKSISGLSLMLIREKDRVPARSNAMNRTIGATGLRIDHAEMLRKLIGQQSF